MMKEKILSEHENILCECGRNIELNEEFECNSNSCPKVCHQNCKCFLTSIYNWFCNIFDWNGKCRKCGHSISMHVKQNYIYKEYEKIKIIDRIKELKLIDEHDIVKKEDEDYLIMINNVEDYITRLINHYENEKRICETENNDYIERILLIELDGIKVFNKIKKNLITLNEKALQKNNTQFNEYVDNYLKNEQFEGKQNFIKETLENYKKIEERESNIDNLSIQRYKEIKNL